MMHTLRKLRGVIGIGLIWAPIWVVLFFAMIGSVLSLFAIFNLKVGGSDSGPLWWIATMGWVGFVSGSTFAFLISLAENGKAIRDISLPRAALWGILASAVFPLMTQREDQVFWTCPVGGIIAILLIVLTHKADLRNVNRPARLRDVFSILVFTLMRDLISPANESAIRRKPR